jgi:hypothetical protein
MVMALTVAAAQAEPNAVLYELQERCGKRAAEVFQRDWGKLANRPGFESHYNARLNKCLMKIWGGDENGDWSSLWDVNESKRIAHFSYHLSTGLTLCDVEDRECYTGGEWEALAKPYMRE